MLTLLLLRFIPTVLAQQAPFLIPPEGTMRINGMPVPNCNFITGDLHYHCIPIYLAYLIQLLFSMVGTICLVMIMWAGFEWAFSGLESDTQKAKSRLRNAILGLILCVLSFMLVDTVISAVFS